MEAFAPIPSLIGGVMIGLASAILWLGNGRIAGISGIFGQLLPPARTVTWRIVFLASMVVAAFAAALVVPGLGVGGPGGKPVEMIGGPLWIGAAGLLVGLGTKIGNGCTSGHGVCGIARFSLRSLIAVVVFFVVAILVVAITGVV
ncbi:Putative transmembrane protein [hydrothermal vent metagenome]|uniref:Transmembrane protein n=1 Tax=hydrothermal vent metagenome TaxID=652676 RepID=A0A3B0USQ9_9ZZZZ